MSAKWRALQHRHRYTYNAVVFPHSYINSLNSLQLELDQHHHQSSSKFLSALTELISMNSSYAQVNHAKKVASAFTDLLANGEEGSVSKASLFYLEVLFCENSLPLHRTLISALAKSYSFQYVICECFRKLCEEYGNGDQGSHGKRFCVSRVALSILGMPKLGYLVGVVENCALLIARDIVTGLNSVVSETNGWGRPSPIVMEQCQEALSCSYYLLQRFSSKFQDLDCEDSRVMENVVTVTSSILKSSAFSRDCLVAAGVSFCAALQVCLSPHELGWVIIEGIFNTCSSSLSHSESEFRKASAKVPFQGDIFSEIHGFSLLSRLCLIRGILTAISRTVLNRQFSIVRQSSNGYGCSIDNGNSVKTILYDAILTELCYYCENPTDSHFNFHALTVMQICLQQIKTSLLANLSDLSSGYNPLPEETESQILRIIWNNLEDPLSQTVKQVHLIFDLFLDIQSTLRWSETSQKIKSFLQKISSDLLRLGPCCKGRYVPLALLTKRLGPKAMLDMSPALLYETAQAYSDDDVCCAATSFLKCFLESFRDECWSSDGIESGYALYRAHCLPPILYGLASGVSKLRSNLNTYALPLLFDVDIDSIFPMLAFISVEPCGPENDLLHPELGYGKMELSIEQKVAILVSLLKVSRLLALIEGDIDWLEHPTVEQKNGVLHSEYHSRQALICIKGVNFEIPVEWLVLALTHVDESLRVDAAETLFLNPKTSSLPSHLELALLKEAVPLNMRCSSTAFQMKWASLFRKVFSRVRTALERQVKQGDWKPLTLCDNNKRFSLNGSEETLVNRAEDLFLFMRWLSCFLFFSCYPSAPYKRKIMAMDLLLTKLNVWSIVTCSQEDCISVSPETHLHLYNKGITSPNSTLLLVGSIVDSWDRLRENSVRILLHFPNPLPGISSEDMVCKVITWARRLVCSQRVRESDAGALTLRLIFRKYVLELGSMVRASNNVYCSLPNSELEQGGNKICEPRHPVIEYLKSLIDWLEFAVKEGERDLSQACQSSFVHGVLLSLRYTFEELDWDSDVVISSISEMRKSLEKLLELVMRITSLALWVVSADAWYLPEDMDEMGDDNTFMSQIEVLDDTNVSVSSPDHEEPEDKKTKPVQDGKTSEQIVMAGCWLAMKEVSFLLGTIIRKIPLPTGTYSDSLGSEGTILDALVRSKSDEVLDLKQLERIGDHFLEVLLKMKHNGAIDKTRAGFTALCNRLLCSNDPRLCKLTESWMEQLMQRTVAKGQVVDDLLRRSAGIPAAFSALFLSEPEGAPKKLLPLALGWLINVAKMLLVDPDETVYTNGDSLILKVNRDNNNFLLPPKMDVNEKSSKIRDEGVIPTVHAFNILRAAFNDTNLATDTSGFSAEALIVAIRAFSSPYWEIRNSACLAYTALVRRIIGFLNVRKRESARRAITGLEFFHRYPTLHRFLINELKVATDLFDGGSYGTLESNLAKAVHPSLCPMLILLSRLKPSTVASEAGDDLDPFLFMPFIRRCSTQSNLRIRVLASRALSGLVSNEKLPSVLLNIASELPQFHERLTLSTERKSQMPLNSIHGILLQLISLLDTNCRNLVDFLKKDQILGDLVQVLSKCSWIASPRSCPCPIVNASFLQALDHMLSIVISYKESESFSIIRNFLLELSTECLDVETSHDLSYYDPTIAELRQQAAISYFSCIFQISKESEEIFQMPQISPPNTKSLKPPLMDNVFLGLKERLVRSLQDSSYEVRLATLKWLLKFLKSTESGTDMYDLSSKEIRTVRDWNKSNLQETLSKLLTLEKHHRCLYYILRILFTWNLLQFRKSANEESSKTVFLGNMDCDYVFQFWNRLAALYKYAKHAKTQETIICCMGICIKRFAGLYSTLVLSYITGKESSTPQNMEEMCNCIAHYTDLIKEHSASSEPANMRKASAESVIASGLLEQAEVIGSFVVNNQISSENSCPQFEPGKAVNLYARQVLDIWFTCIRLLEDENDEIRQSLALDVQKCFSLSGRSSPVPNQVDKVIRSSFKHLSSIFGHWIEYLDFLLQWVLNAANNYVSIQEGDFVRRVFDKEIDNHHEEKLLIGQICCFHLEKLSKSWSVDLLDKKWFGNYLWDWRMRFCHQLISFAELHAGKNRGVDWIGGVGNHKDAFLPFYANLLGFYTLSNCIFNGKAKNGMDLAHGGVVEIGRVIGPFLQNPIISNLYLLVIKTHEKVGVSTEPLIPESSACDSLWDGFDPYFLLW